ncbi:uncharacterized protein LOC135090655 [Scylla paramamosain]|uniref:uncharacterized protein LOC135090655 n=1 Tax=Scylla paramamosain TaxID=85552 RepID=UPI003083A0F6
MPKTEDLERRRRLRGTARGKLTRKCNLLSEQVKQGKPSSIIEDYYEEVKDAFRELERRHEDVMDALCESDQEEEDFNGKLKNEEQYIVQAELLKTGACETLLQLCKKEKETALTDSATKVKVKPIEPPKFEGDIRQYQTFRSNYDKIMTVNYGENAFALKQCLSGEALSVVHGVDDDYKEMFRRLDQRYADPVRLTDTVINQLQELKPIAEGNTGKFVETVEVIEKCWTDMSKNNLEVQMSTVIVISLIEKILPPQQKREWTKIYQNLSNKVNAFPELLKYLKEEKNVLDYIDKDVRKRSHNSKATVHSVEVKEDDSQIMRTLQKLQLQQAEHQANMESIMQKFTQTLSSGGSQVGRHRQNYGNPNFCWYHNSDSHTISRCNTFHNLEPSNKMEVLRKNHVCFHCLAMGHSSKDCQEKRSCYMKLGNGNVCGKPHHPRLHYLLYQNDINIHTNKSDGCTLLMIGQVNCKDDSLVTLFDPGSTSSLVTHRKARDLGLCGTPYNITMTTVGNVSDTVFTKMYKMPLVDETGKQYLIQCVGMDEITSEVNPVPMDIILSQLGVSQSMHIFRPHGRVDLLIGADSCDIIPTTVKTVGKLQLMKGPFGYCVRGSHPELKNEYTEHYVAQVNHMSLTSNTFEIQGEICRTFKEDIDNLFAMDHLGTNCRPKCTNCINCKDCNRETHITVKEEEEMKLILSGLEYQEKEKTWTVHYPWIKDPHHLPNNFGVALMKLKGTEKRLKKLGSRSTENYKVQIDDMLKRGVARKLNREELNWYKGPVHYLSHHEVLKQSSASTPTRIVFNASASYNGHVLNNYWAKGPNVMNSLFGLLLRFREGSIAFVGDIAKMFNSIRLSEFDSHVHRFLWRDFEDRAPDHYALTAVPFGDICSPAIAILAMRQTAEKCKEEFPEAANVIVQDSYMDDIIHSMNDTEKASQIIKDVELILNRGNFHMKEWIISGKTQVGNDVDLSGIPGEKVLGLVWNPVEDEISFKMKMKSTCKQTCSVEVKSNSDEPQNPLTKRKALSYISTIFDPMGFVTPVTLRGKLLMRQIIEYIDENGRKLDWDDPLPEEFIGKWYKFCHDMHELGTIKLPRCICNAELVEPTLILFNDASTLAYSACAYARWRVGKDKYQSKLLAAKSRLAPIKTQTIPRLELSSAVLSVRLRNTIMNETNIRFDHVHHFTDSEIVLSQITKHNIKAGTYVANRIVEIKESSLSNEWHWISTEVNIADLMTRSSKFVDMGPTSCWQCGPTFLELPFSQWPMKSISPTPEIKSIINTAEVNNWHINDCNMFDIDRFNSYRKIIGVTARVLNALHARSFKGILASPTVDQLKQAEILWIKRAQISLTDNWEKRFKRLGPFCKDGIIYVGSRIAAWLKNNYNNEAFILLPTKHRLTEVCIKDIHDKDHGGIESTLCKLQAKFWIPQARKLIKSVKSRCVTCRRLEKQVIGQSMGPVPEERLKPSPLFYHSALDLFGPLMIKDTVKGRCKKKVYGVVVNCLSTRASYVDLVEGYDTDSLITTLRRFTAIRGFPHSMYSDHGSQLKLASKEVCFLTQDQEKLSQFSREGGMEWKFTKSADAPWENGCSEAMVKLVKRVMTRVIGDSTLTFGELQSAMFEIANMLNERPIGMKNGSDCTKGSYLCPNDLILGRASVHTPEGVFDSSTNTRTRQRFINAIVKSFWKKWMMHYFSTLIVQQKWHCEKRNLRVGDIVLVQDSNNLKGHWKLAEVCQVLPSSDGKVRDVQIRYKLQSGNSMYKGHQDIKVNRSVHKLVLILPIEEQ